MPSAPGHPAVEEYDRQYQVWVERQGARALDLDWRLTHLLWWQRALLRRYPPEGKRVLDFGCMDGIFTLRLQQLGGEAVAQVLAGLLDDAALRARLGAAGRRAVESHYNWDRVTADLVRIGRELGSAAKQATG